MISDEKAAKLIKLVFKNVTIKSKKIGKDTLENWLVVENQEKLREDIKKLIGDWNKPQSNMCRCNWWIG